MFINAMQPAINWLSDALWRYTMDQMTGAVVGDISGPVKDIYDAFDWLWVFCGRQATRGRLIVGAIHSVRSERARIAQRAHRLAEPEIVGDDEDDDVSDDSIDQLIDELEYYQDF